jgi:hypothetical protein
MIAIAALVNHMRGAPERLSSSYRDPHLTDRLLTRVALISDAGRIPVIGKPRIPLKRKLAAERQRRARHGVIIR